ncbi:hypothetical protein ASPVEDRAFT_30221 [Aspergillus versicolor CBS 583.65]|uniref:Uncharacterized protein n=1 Tax=Aspergillus versicolor CBS 583.65 TaxID=1036611 RepID=A0A1L9PQD4_ASPVE|nr:uncharacterized protein ASPVEDRAFT_30221 [Aspergillus versicolor CBS 583.65]OJJ03721.1 hypothetical protein ASPVEDRAFT_30221 [Aspergillus versicolor CBS 583.65]
MSRDRHSSESPFHPSRLSSGDPRDRVPANRAFDQFWTFPSLGLNPPPRCIWNTRWTSPTDKATLLSVLGHYPEHGTGAMWRGHNHQPFLAQEGLEGALMVGELHEASIGGGRCSRIRKVRRGSYGREDKICQLPVPGSNLNEEKNQGLNGPDACLMI